MLDNLLQSDSTALHYASNMGHEEIATLLLNKGADVNARNEVIPLSEEILLLKYCALCEQFGRTPLQYAANFKHINVVTLLLDHGADINAQDTVRVFLFYSTSFSLKTLSTSLLVWAKCSALCSSCGAQRHC